MALRTLHCGVLALQRVRRRGMFFQSVGRRLEPLQVVTGRTLACIGALAELRSMRAWAMAVRAFFECQRLFKVSVGVALRALHFRVFSQKRVLGLRMIEAFADGSN